MTVDQIKWRDLASPGFKANPYPIYARLRVDAPVYRIRAPLGLVAWLVTRYEDVLSVLKDERFSNNWPARMPDLLRRLTRPILRHMMTMDPPDHTRLRTLVNKAFTPRRIEGLRERIENVCAELLDAAAVNGGMDLVRGYALPLPLTIIAEMLGIPPQDRRRFQSYAKRIVDNFGSVPALPRFLANTWLLKRHLRQLFAQRRADPQDDMLTALVQAEEAGDRLSEDELLAMVTLILAAGYETTVNLIANGSLALLQHPQQLHHLRQNPELAETAVEELLRYTSPLEVAGPRIAREELTLRSVTIARGEAVMGVLASANHDESQFRDPENLDITREPNKHVAFGFGAHFCLGAPLARLEGQIALTTLFRRFPNLRLAQPPESLRWRKVVFFRGLEKLPVAF